MERILCDGNEAAGRAAIAAGCKYFFGYPITPQNELAEFLSRELPKIGGVYLQSEGENAASYMLFGAAQTGVRVMTATSSPGFSLMQEAISHMALAEVSTVIVEVTRLGPGVGTGGQHGQTDYRQVTKGGGHGGYRSIVLAPASVQEIYDLTQLAFYLADQYRMLVIVLTDFILARMQESVELRTLDLGPLPPKDWALTGKAKHGGQRRFIFSPHILGDIRQWFLERNRKYQQVIENETRYDSYQAQDAELLAVAYGSSARTSRRAVDMARAKGLKVGLFRPITLWPFPEVALRDAALRAGKVLVVEDSGGEMVEDVQFAVQGKVPVHLLGIWGRHLPGTAGLIHPERILEEMESLL